MSTELPSQLMTNASENEKNRGPGKTGGDYFIRLGKVQVQGPGIQAKQKKAAKFFKMYFDGRFRHFGKFVHTISARFLGRCRFFLY